MAGFKFTITIKFWLKVSLPLLACALVGCSTAPAQPNDKLPALIPIRNLVAEWSGSGGYQISPDGQRLMWVARNGIGPGLFVKHLKNGEIYTYKIPGGGVWAHDSRYIFVQLSNNGDENTHIWSVDTDTSNQALRDLTPFDNARSSILRTLRHSNDLIILSNRRDSRFNDVYRYFQATGELTLLANNPGNVGQWLVNDEGELIGRTRLEVGRWIFETPDVLPDQPWLVRFEFDYFDTVVPVASSANPNHWWALSNRGRDKQALVEIDLRDGSERVEHADARVDISGWLWSYIRKNPLAVSTDPDTQAWQTFDTRIKSAFDNLRGETDARIVISNLSDDERWMSATVIRHNGGEHILYDLQNQTSQILAAIGRTRIAVSTSIPPQNPVTFKSRDGLILHGYLSIPMGVKKPYPTVLLVHGGPWGRDFHNSNDPMLAFLTNRGYAVLQVNFRGSSGYGKAFMESAQGEFAGKMHDDLIDAVTAFAAQGILDPERVAISGASYGGYASLVGMTHTPGKFRCAISTVGMSDLAALLDDAPPYWELSKPHWVRYIGDPTVPKQRLAMQEKSPLYKVNRVQGPILLMHGMHDPRVKVSQSIDMAHSLQALGKPVELLLADKAGHGFQRWQDKLVSYRRTEDFLAKCLGGRTGGFDFFELGSNLN